MNIDFAHRSRSEDEHRQVLRRRRQDALFPGHWFNPRNRLKPDLWPSFHFNVRDRATAEAIREVQPTNTRVTFTVDPAHKFALSLSKLP